MNCTRNLIRPNNKQGFTLLEILIAIFILALIVGMVLGPFTGIMANTREAERKVDLYQTGRALMDLLSADVRGIFPQPVEGEGIFFQASSESLEGFTTMPRLDFVTTHSLLIGPYRNPFLCEVGYRFQKDKASQLYTLWRRAESPPTDPYDEGGRDIPLCRIIESFKVQFVSGDEATEELTDQIPKAMILEFTLNMDGEKETFVTMVRPMVTARGMGEGVNILEPVRRGTDASESRPAQQKGAR